MECRTARQWGIMVWGAIAYDSRSSLVRIQGTMTAQRYLDNVLRPVAIPYFQGLPNAICQQDNAQPHSAPICQRTLQGIQMLPWPLYSPDLSPIEHVWDVIGCCLQTLPLPHSEDELCRVKHPFEWNDEAEKAFTSAKMTIAEATFLRHAVPGPALKLGIDAYDVMACSSLMELNNSVWELIGFLNPKFVKTAIQSCLQCEHSKIHAHSKSPLGTFFLPDARFAYIGIDFIGPLPLSENNNYCMTIIDRFTRRPEAIAIIDISAQSTRKVNFDKSQLEMAQTLGISISEMVTLVRYIRAVIVSIYEKVEEG
ncbi:Transposable element Tcb1 transposase, partial [Stegodyphus mimosarum]